MNVKTFITKIESIYGRYQSNDLKLLVMDKLATVKAPLADVLVAVVETFSTRWGVQPGLVEIEEGLKRERADRERAINRLPAHTETEMAEQDRMREARGKPPTFSKAGDALERILQRTRQRANDGREEA